MKVGAGFTLVAVALALGGCSKKDQVSELEASDDEYVQHIDAGDSEDVVHRVPEHSNRPFPARRAASVERPLPMDDTILDVDFTLERDGKSESGLKCVRGDSQELYGIQLIRDDGGSHQLTFHCALVTSDRNVWRLTWNFERPESGKKFGFKIGDQPELALAQVEVLEPSTTVTTILPGANGAFEVSAADTSSFEVKGRFTFESDGTQEGPAPAFKLHGSVLAQY